MFIFSLNHISDIEKRHWYANLNFINKLQLNPQINKNSEKYKTMINTKLTNTKRQLTNRKWFIASPT
jgi:hypothetical protein